MGRLQLLNGRRHIVHIGRHTLISVEPNHKMIAFGLLQHLHLAVCKAVDRIFNHRGGRCALSAQLAPDSRLPKFQILRGIRRYSEHLLPEKKAVIRVGRLHTELAQQRLIALPEQLYLRLKCVLEGPHLHTSHIVVRQQSFEVNRHVRSPPAPRAQRFHPLQGVCSPPSHLK